MADVQFPTNNFDAAHGGKQPDNTDNTDAIASNNYGRSRTAPTLYSDERYLDGDGFLYGLGMTAQRVLVKGKDLTAESSGSGYTLGGLEWSNSTPAVTNTLGIKLKKEVGYNVSGLEIKNGLGIKYVQNGPFTVDPTDGLSINPKALLWTLAEDDCFGDGLIVVDHDSSHDALTLDPNVAGNGLVFTSGKVLNVLLRHSKDAPPVNTSGLALATDSEYNTAGLYLQEANSYNYGGIKIGYQETSGVKSYAVKLNNGKAYVDVPWVNSTIEKDNTNPNPIILEGSGDKTINFAYSADNFDVALRSGTTQYELTLNKTTASTLGGVLVEHVATEGNDWAQYLGRIGRDINTGLIRVQVPHTETINGNVMNIPGVVNLYNSLTASTDTHTDGSVTQAAIHSAYESLSQRIDDLEDLELEFKIAASLPTASESQKHYIYLIPISGASAPDAYAEYVCVNKGTSANPNWAWEKIGDTNIDLSGYIQKTDVLTATEVATIVSDVFGF